MIKPLNDKLVIEEVEFEKTHSSGIILQSNVTGEVKRAKALAVGKDVESVKEGDVLLIDWQFASKSQYEGKIIFIVKEENVIAVVEPD